MNEDLEYIKKFSRIKVSDACDKIGVKRNNLWSGKASKQKIKKIRKILESNVAELYLLREDDEDVKTKNIL